MPTPFPPAPLDFREDVERAAAARHLGDLELLANEVQGFEWESDGLRIVTSALAALHESSRGEIVSKLGRIILFTGHMIDAPGRKTPRFPAPKEGAARQAIREAVQKELSLSGGIAFGVAGGASGGDTLFHEVCGELGVPTKLFLALPPEEYVQESVLSGGPQWVERFHRILASHPPRILSEARKEPEYQPRWLREKPDYGIWQRNTLWMLHNVVAERADGIILIALWDRKAGDGPGGTADVVQKASERGAKIVILDTNTL